MKVSLNHVLSASLLLAILGFSPASASNPTAGGCGETRSADWLIQLIKTKHPKTKKELLHSLPVEYRQMYVLMKQTSSQQSKGVAPTINPAKGEYGPRYIGFGRNASLVIAMTGDPSDPTLEYMQIDSKTGQPSKMAKINFLTGEPVLAIRSDVSAKGTAQRFPTRTSAGHPHAGTLKCTECHGDSPTTIWSPYFLWPDAYGAVEDGTTQESVDAPPSERANFKKVWNQTHPVGTQPPQYPNSMLSELEPQWAFCMDYKNACLSEVVMTPGKGSKSCSGVYKRSNPNESLGMMLTRKNAVRVSHLMRNNPKLGKLRYALVAAANCYERDVTSFVNRFLGPEATKLKDPEAYFRRTAEALDANEWTRVQDILGTLPPDERKQIVSSAEAAWTCENEKSPQEASGCRSQAEEKFGRIIRSMLSHYRKTSYRKPYAPDSAGHNPYGYDDIEQVMGIARYRALIEGAGQASMDNWSPAKYVPNYSFNDGIGGLTARLQVVSGPILLDCPRPTAEDKPICEIFSRSYDNTNIENFSADYGIGYGREEDQANLCKMLEASSLKALGPATD